MLTQHPALQGLEQSALNQLKDIDLELPTQQIQQALEALVEIPTVVRGMDTPFSTQAEALLAILKSRAHTLCIAVEYLSTHINRHVAPRAGRVENERRGLLLAVAE